MIEKIREYEISIEKYMREKQDILHEMEQQKVEEINIIDKEKITELNRRKMGNMIADRQSIKVSNEKQIEELNK
jgi:membrane-bound lytic murein transglycosylase MltF